MSDKYISTLNVNGSDYKVKDSKRACFVITEDMVTVSTDTTKGVAPYNTSYGYTNITITGDCGCTDWVEGALYSFIVNTSMVVSSTYRNLRIRMGTSGAWKPVMYTSAILYSPSYFQKSYNAVLQYKSTYQTSGALHLLNNDNSTYAYLQNYTHGYSVQIDSSGYGAQYSLLFPTDEFTASGSTTTVPEKYSSLVMSCTTAATKAVSSKVFYIDRDPLYNPNSSIAAGGKTSGSLYQKYYGMDLRYTYNTSATYMTAYRKAFLWLKDYDIHNHCFVADATEGNIVTIDKLSTRWATTVTDDIYLYFLGWTYTNWYQLAPNVTHADRIYKYNAQTQKLTLLEAPSVDYYSIKRTDANVFTWAVLKSKRDNKELVPGQEYRISDYICTTTQDDTTAATHPFQIILTANTSGSFSETARALSTNTYFKECNANAWELKYCIDNDTDRFKWADTTNGKGVIYYMKDEYGNEAPYDFKNIMFIRKLDGDGLYDTGGTSAYVYTFNAYSASTCYDASVYQELMLNDEGGYTYTSGNIIKPYTDDDDELFNYEKTLLLNNNVLLNSTTLDEYYIGNHDNFFDTGCFLNTLNVGCARNNFGKHCYDNVLGYYCEYNTFAATCFGNVLEDGCTYNNFNENCLDNKLGTSSSNNSFGHNCQSLRLLENCAYNQFSLYCIGVYLSGNCASNTFGSRCFGGTLGAYSSGNTFGNCCSGNSIGNYCYGNSFSDACTGNSLGTSCSGNSFGNYSTGNTLGSSCVYNTFGEESKGNTLANSCSANTFGNSCHTNKFQSSCKGNKLGNGCVSNHFSGSCCLNSMEGECTENTLNTYCNYNTFMNSCRANVLATLCGYNHFGNYSIENSLLASCYNNSFGENNGSNVFGALSSNNVIGNGSGNVTLGEGCSGNTIGNNCTNIVCGIYCNSNSFGNGCEHIRFGLTGTTKGFYENITVDGNVKYIYINCTGTLSETSKLQNIHVNGGVSGTSSSYLTLASIVTNAPYTLEFAKNSSGTLKLWNLADYIYDNGNNTSY